jgi:MFS family permease
MRAAGEARVNAALHDADERVRQTKVGGQRDDAARLGPGHGSLRRLPRLTIRGRAGTKPRPCPDPLRLSNPSRQPKSASAAADVGTVELLLIVLCFVLSGAAALVYQIAWTRQFALVFGTSELAVATVLAAYMGGLALGAWLVERWLPRVQRPVLAYAVLELGIAIAAVVLVPLLLQASSALAAGLRGRSAVAAVERAGIDFSAVSGTAFVALAVPTTLMGATLPLLARHAVHSPEQIGQRIGMLYASNTLGAVLGALLAAFVLLPALGLQRSVWTGAALNLLVFLLAAAGSRSVGPSTQPAAPARADSRRKPTPPLITAAGRCLANAGSCR